MQSSQEQLLLKIKTQDHAEYVSLSMDLLEDIASLALQIAILVIREFAQAATQI